ncbi:MAG: hypothetical protein V1787_01080, partial [Candidatus Micrarchaeota archaeon]
MTSDKSRVSAVALIAFAALACASDGNFLDANAPSFTSPGGTVYVYAAVANSSNAIQYLEGYNVSASLNTSNMTNTTNSSSPQVLELAVPASLYGEYNITVTDNSTENQTKVLPLYVTNVSNASFAFIDRFPPYSAGANFTINVTLRHVNGSLMPAGFNLGLLSIKVFSANGNDTGWTVANLSGVDSAGTARYRIVVPSNRDGQFALVVDKGAGFLVFMVKSGYTMAVSPQDSNGDSNVQYAPGQAASVLAKIRGSTGGPVTSGVTATAFVTLPNGTVRNFSLTQSNSTAFPGFYNGSFGTLNSSLTGQYDVRVEATVGTQVLEGYTRFTSQTFSARFQEKTGFFEDWGGKRAIMPGSGAEFDLIATNLTDGAVIAGGMDADNSTNVNCSQLENVTIYWAQNHRAYGDAETNYSEGTFEGTSVCRARFLTPSLSGPWMFAVNASIGGSNATAGGFLQTQNYFLKVRPVQAFGGDESFMAFMPDTNVTFDLSAFNLQARSVVNGTNITAASVKRVRALTFGSGVSDETSVQYWISNGTQPQVTVTLPSDTTGPIIIEVEANVTNSTSENVTGSAMVLAKYVDGFLGPNNQGDGPPVAKCTGTQEFSGMVKDIRTNQNAQGVTLNGVSELREEFSGRDLGGCVNSSSASSSSSSEENLAFNVTFASNSSCGFSGGYFMIMNVTYQGKTDFLPAGFLCKQLRARVSTYIGDDQAFQIAPQDNFTINVSNIRTLAGQDVDSGSFSIMEIMNFNPSSGMRRIEVTGGTDLTNTTIASGSGAFNLTPANFSVGGVPLARWPSGFLDIRLRICGGGQCDEDFNGVQIVDFMAWPNFQGNAQFYPGQSVTVDIYAFTNVSSNETGFSVKLGKPWEGQAIPVQLDAAFMIDDNWNTSGDQGYEKWNVTFSIPADAPKGFQPAIITVNSSAHNATMELFVPLRITKYQVMLPSEEGVQIYSDNMMMRNSTEINDTGFFRVEDDGVYDGDGNYVANSTSGRYCMLYSGFNTTRFGMQQTTVEYNQSWRVLLVDNSTPMVYDTVLFNESAIGNGRISFANQTGTSYRNITTNNSGLQLWSIFDCAFFTIANTTAVTDAFNNWGGSHEVDVSFLIPYLVKQAGVAQEGARLGVKAIIKQVQTGDGQGGAQGFEEAFTEGADYEVNSEAVTDGNGFGFINITVRKTGPLMLFWNLSLQGGDTDTAGFDSGTFLEVRNFDTYG